MSYNDFLNRLISCKLCPRLVMYRSSFPEGYWRKPVPPNGSIDSKIMIVGLAPAGKGGNRTGRMFTGDESANNLMKALYAVGLASQPFSVSKDDGLKLYDVYITSAVKCAPPENRPTSEEIKNCSIYLKEELMMAKNVKVIVALGIIAWNAVIDALRELGYEVNKEKFSHGKILIAKKQDREVFIIGAYHPSPRNVKTRRLSIEMLEDVFKRAKELSGIM